MPDATARVVVSGTKPGTSWVGVGGGVLVTMGVAALLTPIVGAYLATISVDFVGASAAVPVLVALTLAALLGGFIAGRIAKRRAGWHGLLSGLVVLLLTGSYLLISVAVQRSYFGIDGRFLPEFFPGVLTLSQYHSEAALTLGLIGLPAQILAAWFGGLLGRPRPAAAADPSPRIVGVTPGPAILLPIPVSRKAPTPL